MPYKDVSKKRARAKIQSGEYYRTHREQRLAYHKDYRKRAPDARKNTTYKYVFGIELKDVLLKLQNQGGICAICSKPLNSLSGGTKPQLDHDHSNGMIRDLLCVRCNRVLGHVGDSIELLMKFIAYIRRHKENPSGDVAKSWKRLNEKSPKTISCISTQQV